MALQRINLSGGSYDARAVSVAAQRVLNLYAEPIPAADGEPIQFAYYLTPGLKKFAQMTGPVETLYQATNGDLIAVSGGVVAYITDGGGVVELGATSSGSGPARICDNGTTLFVVNGGKGGWYCTMPSQQSAFSYTVNSAVDEGSTAITIESAFQLVAGYTYKVSGTGIASGTTIIGASPADSVTDITTLTLSAATTADIDAAATISVTTVASTRYGPLVSFVDDAFYGSPVIDILDTFFLFTNPDTSNWYTSPAQFADENQTPFDGLYVASDATSLSTIMGLAVVGQYIWLFSRTQVEFW